MILLQRLSETECIARKPIKVAWMFRVKACSEMWFLGSRSALSAVVRAVSGPGFRAPRLNA